MEPKRAMLLAPIGVLLVGLVTAGVAAGLDDGNTIHACAKNQGGDLRLVEDGDDCLPSETLVEWNVQGPQGVPGTAAAHVHTDSETSDASFFAVIEYCDYGEVALGGGYHLVGPGLGGAQVRNDRPISSSEDLEEGATPNGWYVAVNKPEPLYADLELTLTVWVICAPTSITRT